VAGRDDYLGNLLRAATDGLSNADARAELERFEAEYQQRIAAGTVPEFEPPPRPSLWRRAISTVRAWWLR
jgi:hypothetical protein